MAKRIGIVGLGYIGGYLYQRITEEPALGLEIAFVWNRSREKRAGYPAHLVLEDLAEFESTGADLIVEAAHPDISRDHGERFLQSGDYMITSTTALADDELRERLLAAALKNGRRIYLPHGALVGVNFLSEQQDEWKEVTITFRKNPGNIDFSETTEEGGQSQETVIFDGPVREVAKRFPRNVNTMVTCALASLGLDKTRGVLIADPSLKTAIAEVEAIGKNGGRMVTIKEQPVVGVSGTEMPAAILNSVLKAADPPPGFAFI